MTKEQALDLLMLLSALESWAMSQKIMIPDYLHEQLGEQIELARKIILDGDAKQ